PRPRRRAGLVDRLPDRLVPAPRRLARRRRGLRATPASARGPPRGGGTGGRALRRRGDRRRGVPAPAQRPAHDDRVTGTAGEGEVLVATDRRILPLASAGRRRDAARELSRAGEVTSVTLWTLT